MNTASELKRTTLDRPGMHKGPDVALWDANVRSDALSKFAGSQRRIQAPVQGLSGAIFQVPLAPTSSLVHPSHHIVDEDISGIASDPVCQKCRLSVYDSITSLQGPCVAPPSAPAAPPAPPVDLSILSLPDDDAKRGQFPMADGLLDYFPNALAEIAKVSKIGNDQHNPGQPMHWARDKSTDHANKIMRHLVDRGRFDGRGVRHTARLAWRALAMLQTEIEQEEGFPQSRRSTAQAPIQASA